MVTELNLMATTRNAEYRLQISNENSNQVQSQSRFEYSRSLTRNRKIQSKRKTQSSRELKVEGREVLACCCCWCNKEKKKVAFQQFVTFFTGYQFTFRTKDCSGFHGSGN